MHSMFCQTSSMAEDQVHLSSFCQMHKCSDYCLRHSPKKPETNCDLPTTEKEKQVRQNNLLFKFEGSLPLLDNPPLSIT